MSDAGAPTSVRLRYRGADVFLSDGSYLVGRGASCQLVIDDPRASRRHARLVIGGGSVSVEDLGSANGVFVNGIRVARGRQVLADGDRISIGGTELELKLGVPSSKRGDRETLASGMNVSGDSEPPATPVRSFDSDPPVSGAGTQRAEVFELVGPLASKAIAQGRAVEAENILGAHLGKVLDDYKKGRRVPDATRDHALRYSLELAAAMNSQRWLSYAFELLVFGRVLLDAKLAARLLSTLSRVDVVDPTRVSAYVTMLRELPQSYEKMRALHEAEELSKATARKR